MIKVYNSIIPFQGYLAMTIYPFIFIRSNRKDRYTEVADNHESIHGEQQKELLWIFFFIIYILEWFIKLFIFGSKAYRHISFEQEAYTNEKDMDYLGKRKHYASFKYIFK